jgi:hypothetical protein
MLAKDRWVGPREQVFNLLIACRSYGPSKASSLPSTEGGFTPTTSVVALGEKLGTDPWINRLLCWGLGREPFFSGAVALSNAVDVFADGCYALTT